MNIRNHDITSSYIIHAQNVSARERGQSMVELGFSMVILLILLAGIVDLTRAFYTYVALHDAAQEGAMYGSINPTDFSGINMRVRDTSQHPVDLSDTGVIDVVSSYSAGDACANGVNGIQVTVRYNDFLLTMPLLGTIVGSQSITIEADAVNTILKPPC